MNGALVGRWYGNVWQLLATYGMCRQLLATFILEGVFSSNLCLFIQSQQPLRMATMVLLQLTQFTTHETQYAT